MKKDNKKALYESIMASVAKEVKKALNEEVNDEYQYDPIALKHKKYHLAIILPNGGGNFVYYASTGAEAIKKAQDEFPNAKEITITYPKNDFID